MSLRPWLADPATPRERPAVTTWHYKNHSVRSARYRYICYRDGSEELYDHTADPGEHANLAGKPGFDEVLAEHRRFLPSTNTNFSDDPNIDKYGSRLQQWRQDDEEIPDWLK